MGIQSSSLKNCYVNNVLLKLLRGVPVVRACALCYKKILTARTRALDPNSKPFKMRDKLRISLIFPTAEKPPKQVRERIRSFSQQNRQSIATNNVILAPQCHICTTTVTRRTLLSPYCVSQFFVGAHYT